MSYQTKESEGMSPLTILPVLAGIFIFLAFSVSGNAQPSPKPLWLLITRPVFVEAMQPLIRHRTEDGFKVIVSVENISSTLSKLKQKPAYIVLAGDYEAGRRTTEV